MCIRDRSFDKAAYDKNYHKTNYKQLAVVFTKAEAAEVEQAAQRAGISKSAYMKAAILEKIEREE